MYGKIFEELKKKKKNIKRSRQGNTAKQASRHNPKSDIEQMFTEHMTNDQTLDLSKNRSSYRY